MRKFLIILIHTILLVSIVEDDLSEIHKMAVAHESPAYSTASTAR